MAKKKQHKASHSVPSTPNRNEPSYTNIIHITELHGVRICVAEGNLLQATCAKVLPTNEFFNLSDSDWESSSPRSIVGQYIKQLSQGDRRLLQKSINKALGRRKVSKDLGYPFGHTIIVGCQSDTLLFTNTVKYDLEEVKRRLECEHELSRVGGMSAEIEREMLHSEREWTWYRLQSAIKMSREQIEDLHYRTQVHYDTCLLAIGQCIENILRAAQQHEIENLAIPLLGAGWGGLDGKAVFTTMLSHLNKVIIANSHVDSLPTLTSRSVFPRNVQFVFGPNTLIDRAFVLHSLQERSLCEGLPEPDILRAIEIVRLYKNELDAVQERIDKYEKLGETHPSLLDDRKEQLDKRLLDIKQALSKQVLIEGDQVMGDKYTVGQAGAVGPKAKAKDTTYQQIWVQQQDSVDLEVIAKELALLRGKMRESAKDAEQDIAIGHVAAAETAAKNHDGPGVIQNLKNAGKWTFDFARDLGVNIVAELMKKAMGM